MVREILGQRREGKHRFVRNIGELIEKDTARLEREGKLKPTPPTEENPIPDYKEDNRPLRLIDAFCDAEHSQCVSNFNSFLPGTWFPSAADYYRLFKQVLQDGSTDGSFRTLLKDLQESPSHCVLTSTVISLHYLIPDYYGHILHRAGSPMQSRVPFSIPQQPDEKEIFDYYRAIFGTHDGNSQIVELLATLETTHNVNIHITYSDGLSKGIESSPSGYLMVSGFCIKEDSHILDFNFSLPKNYSGRARAMAYL